MQKKNFNIIIYCLCSISFILSSLLISIHMNCYDENFYHDQHLKLRLNNLPIAEYIGISNDELDKLTHFTLSYLNDPDASLDLKMNIKGIEREVFTDDEKLHMEDVRRLNLASRYLMYISISVFIITMFIIINNRLLKQYYDINKQINKGFMMFIGILALWIIIDFDSFWNTFHRIFFVGNELWILDLSKDILIMIVPPDFFFNLVKRIIITFVCILSVYNILLYFLVRKRNV